MSTLPAAAQLWSRVQKQARATACLDAERERELIGLAQGGDQSALETLVRSHMRLVVKAASRYNSVTLQLPDLVSEGCVGLIEAIKRFDLSRPYRLTTYAKWWIRARVRAYALDNRNLVRLPSTRSCRATRTRLVSAERALSQRLGRTPTRLEVAEELQVDEHEVASVTVALACPDLSLSPDATGRSYEVSDEAPTPESALSEREHQHSVAAQVHTALSKLGARDQVIIRAHFLSEDGPSLADLGEQLGVTRQRVSQIVSRVRKQLKVELSAVAS